MLELLAGAAGAWLVSSGQVLATNGLYGLTLTGIATGCLTHALVYIAMAFLETLLGTGRLRGLGLAYL